MSSRRPLQPIPALSANVAVASTRFARSTTTSKTADGIADMEDPGQDDVQNSDSVVSGLTSLSGDDDFERFMIEKAREERRRLHGGGRELAFRKARPHGRGRLTADNLERSDAHHTGPGAHVNSPPSSSGSTRSDPAIHAPAAWGRKGRTRRDWMRTITRDEPAPPPPALPTQNDSPLSHKSFVPAPAGAARHDSSGELDLTFDMNEASMLVSTPYLPRSTKLDDIRAREVESLREQHLATARLERIREHSPEHTPPEHASPARRLRARTNSWQSLSKSQPELGKENAPIAVYTKSIETVGLVERDVVASAERQTTRPFTTRRTDSQDLLRRLARASNTPSPQATAPRPLTQPVLQPQGSPQTAVVASPSPQHAKDEPVKDMSTQAAATASAAPVQEHPPREQRHDTPHDGTTPDVPSSVTPVADVDATPLPRERPVRNPRTPYVMGGWVDTPGPRTAHKSADLARPQSHSPKQDDDTKPLPSEPATEPASDEQPAVEQSAETTPELVQRPQRPSSALHALVQEARAHHDYGDDTIHSLEELLGPFSDNEADEDTLHGLTLPTSAPRSEAERQRHAEIENMHRHRDHLRAAETNVRDASRGMRRLESLMEHTRTEATEKKIPVVVRDITTQFSPWAWFRSFFWDERLKTQRCAKNAPLKIWGGVTLLGILLTLSFIWWASETVACEIFCHPEYTSYSPYPFAVNMDAPKRGVVIPTLVYRTLFRSWSTPAVSPLAALLSGTWSTLWGLGTSINANALSRASSESVARAAHTQASWIQQEDVHEENSWDWSMAEDEVLRR